MTWQRIPPTWITGSLTNWGAANGWGYGATDLAYLYRHAAKAQYGGRGAGFSRWGNWINTYEYKR